ncbi:MAG: cytochrome [Bdellovibrionales bacterium CG10_big_fil_rev_8_21_14_0_10_45_34]|nr:MAG: cytochrome [Bdellovibrionales bacterium CG10_big_fil_rev_8_21_14_0_10_45_34]
MYLQGQLQQVFDALYLLGVIDPVLEKDWVNELTRLPEFKYELNQVVDLVNNHSGDFLDLSEKLKTYQRQTLEYLAMEVAREFAEYHTRQQTH